MNTFGLLENPTFACAIACYFLAFVLYAITWRSTKVVIARAATGFMVVATLANTGLVILRWIEANRPPFKSLFESLVFLALCIAVIYLVSERLLRTRAFGALSALGSLGSLIYALAKWDAEIVKLPPALQSGWFIPHVAIYFVACGALFFGTIVAVVRLFRATLVVRAGTVFTGTELSLDKISSDAIRFGFVFLTVGFLIGSVWARAAWGDYWVWDPKENWSLVTWLVYASYLHLRHVAGWRGKRGAWLAIIGFAIVMFTYLGMELLPTAEQSSHVYQ
jgi:cytochrome c-type biogenesis protein CcsB